MRLVYVFFLYLRRESNPNLIFRRDLFYPLNYKGVACATKLQYFHDLGKLSVRFGIKIAILNVLSCECIIFVA